MKKKEHIKVSIHMKIDGHLHKMKEVLYQRGRETYAFTLDDLARIIFTWERMFDGSSTYAMDGYLQEAEKKLDKKDGETAESVFKKYWVNFKESWKEHFDEINAGDATEGSIFPDQNDFMLWETYHICNNFNDNVKEVKEAFLYWLVKYVFDNDLDKIAKEVEEMPYYIKDLVDKKLYENG